MTVLTLLGQARNFMPTGKSNYLRDKAHNSYTVVNHSLTLLITLQVLASETGTI